MSRKKRKDRRKQDSRQPQGPKRALNKQQIEQQEKEQRERREKIIRNTYLSVVGVLIVVVIAVMLWIQFKPEKKPDEPVDMFPTIQHINIEHYKVLLGQQEAIDLKDEDKEEFDKINLEYNVYVYIYNSWYDECENCEELESLVTSVAEKEDKDFTFLVLNYAKNEDIVDFLDKHFLPKEPVLVHIEGQTIAEENGYSTNLKAIQSVLAKLRGE